MKKKGFTLIELLAVIVILAIIALIITPIVSDIIESAKKASAMRSIEGYIDAANNAAAVSLIDPSGITVTKDKYSFEAGEDNEALAKVDVSGKRPNYVYLEYDVQLLRVVLANFCYNGYAFDYDNGTITEGVMDYCSVTFTDRPKVVTTADGELSSKVTITINYTENTVGKQYKIGNGEYIDYTEPFELESSRELASQRDAHGNLKICAKATLASGESTEICRSINKLDLEYPADPVIVANVEYPVLEMYGISNGSLSITFDNRSDITNYVSFNGTDWTIYTGSEQILGNTIYAKSVKNASGLTTMATETVESIAADALPMTAYNGDTTDTTVPGTYYLKLGDSIKGDEFEIYWNDDSSNSSAVISFWFADANKALITGTKVTLGGNVGDKVNRYTVNSEAAYLVVKPGHQTWATVREIKPVNEAVITSPDYDYPVWNIDGSVVYDTIHAEIAYQPESNQNLYKIDDGEWTNYTESVVVPLNSTIYAKSIYANGVSSPITSFEATPIADALPQTAYNNDTTDSIPSGKHYLKLGDSLKNKNFDIFWVDTSSNSSCKVSFYYADASKTAISGTTVTLGELAGEKMNTYTINPSAQYIVFSTYWPEYCTIREVRPVNYPEVIPHDYTYPVWRADGSITYDTVHAEIAYDSTTSQKLYKVDNGEWNTYTDRFNVSVGSTIYARSIFASGMQSPVTTYEVSPISDAVPPALYNGDTTDAIAPGTYYLRLDDSVKGKQFKIYWNDSSSNSSYVVSFWYADANKTAISGTTTKLTDCAGDKVNTYTLNSDASYLVIKATNQTYATVREIELID